MSTPAQKRCRHRGISRRKFSPSEQERIFAREWLCVGREESIRKPGDFFTVERAGESLIVTRDARGVVHAFFNVCRHRGSRICTTASGHFQGSIQCPYHAWTYGLDGALKVARNMTELPGFDRAEYPLKEAQVGLWEGFVFVNLGRRDRYSTETFAPLIGRFSAMEHWRNCKRHVLSPTSSRATGSSSSSTTRSVTTVRSCIRSSISFRRPIAGATISPKDRSSAATPSCVSTGRA